MIDWSYAKQVQDLLEDGPTSQDLEELIVAHARIGYMVGVADKQYEKAKADREFADANLYLELKRDDPKSTAAYIEAWQIKTNTEPRTTEAISKSAVVRLKNLLSSIVEAINALKFLGRMGA